MSTYKEINGTAIEALSADPPNPQDGQVWYRSDLGTFKTTKTDPNGAWATGGTLNRTGDKAIQLMGTGTQNDSIAFGGGFDNTGQTELYNGTSWTEVNDLNTGRRGSARAGTSTAALCGGGWAAPSTTVTELWNGTNWTEVNDLNNAREAMAGDGTSTSALAIGGSPYATSSNESWNGTNWTAVNNMNVGRYFLAASGSDNTSAIAIGGEPTPQGSKTESWNGSNWTEVNDLSDGARTGLAASHGSATAALIFGSMKPSVPADGAKAEVWNGTNWSTQPSLNTARGYLAGSGTSTAALAISGYQPGATYETEEFNKPGLVTETITLE
jgi:hypothetical protein